MDDNRLKAAKNLAAVKAFEAYTNTIKEQLGEEGLVAALDGTEHIHTGILLLDGKEVGIFCDWFFSSDRAVILRLIESRQKKRAEAQATKPS